LTKFLFAESTPIPVKRRLQKQFLKNNAEFAIKSIEPLYKMDIRNVCKQVEVPVRAINSNFTPTHVDSIRKYINDFEYSVIDASGHYPMLEQTNQFNLLLNGLLEKIY
jgi:pimeloyl-ACP methyl ester carboxylesterase